MDKNKYELILNDLQQIIQNEKDNIEKYYLIGKVLKENKSAFKGERLVESLSEDLNQKGYSVSSLRHMQNYHKRFKNYPDLYKLSKKLSWNKIITLLAKTYDIKETEYYIKTAIKENWSDSELKKAVDNEVFDNYIATIEDENYRVTVDDFIVKNYKSLVDISINQPRRFSVFVGANASGKSNILEALEFMFSAMNIKGTPIVEMFGGKENVLNRNMQSNPLTIELRFKDKTEFGIRYENDKIFHKTTESDSFNEKLIKSFTRIFVGKNKQNENTIKFQNKLWFDTGNLTKILKKILTDTNKKKLFEANLKTFIPGFENIKINIDKLSGKEELQIFEEHTELPFSGQLISDGTYSIIALLTLLYQSEEPQFICIEEPENGLNPKIITEFVELFRKLCKDKGHYIWLTTHSQTLVSALKPQEIIIVDKINGQTKIAQFNKDKYLIEEYEKGEIKMDEAWLNNTLEGGLPW